MDTSTPHENQPTGAPEDTSTQPNFISTFPLEVRLKIFEYAIPDSLESIQDTINPPALLRALHNHPNPHPYVEAQEIYDHMFRSVNSSNAAAFQREPLKDRLKIKPLEVAAPVNFRGQTITLMNNIEVLTLDFSNEAVALEDKDRELFTPTVHNPRLLAQVLINASKKQGKTRVKRVVLKRREGGALVDNFCEAMDLDVAEQGVLEGEVLYWVWEAEEGETLHGLIPAEIGEQRHHKSYNPFR
ncbi:hypothetical protein N431DRAFT_527010 [Stipitochalara longipes BDJ]|nr:hypothetical protein N431DRAFT_527010 [Stipitochalara longipes BDJ]